MKNNRRASLASATGLYWIAGLLAFLVTDIDDLFVLVAFWADSMMRPHRVVLGQYAGIAFLLADLVARRDGGEPPVKIHPMIPHPSSFPTCRTSTRRIP